MVEVSTEVAVTETPEFHVGDPMLPPAGFPFTPVLPALPHTINIDIRLLGGRLIANFDVSLDDTVREIKQQISQRGWLCRPQNTCVQRALLTFSAGDGVSPPLHKGLRWPCVQKRPQNNNRVSNAAFPNKYAQVA